MHWRDLTTPAIAAAIALAGCGGASSPTATVRTTPIDQRSVQHAGAITVRGDYGPQEHGPYTLRGAYRVRFTQYGQGVTWGDEVPFTAHLETAVSAGGPSRTIPLFGRATRTGTTIIRADGRFTLVVDYGDSPYEVVLTPVA
jgi:hypothetical protein